MAGGYTTCMFFEKEFKPESDIDFFINKGYQISNFLTFINSNYTIIDIQLRGKSVIDIKLLEIKRAFQIIYSRCENVGQLLDSFDFSFCKTAYHKGTTYITYDALLSKNNKVAITYSNPMVGRAEKVKYFDLQILSHDYNVISYLDNNYASDIDIEFNHLSSLQEKIDFLSTGMYSMVDFRRQICSNNNVDVMSPDVKYYMEDNVIKAEQITTTFGCFYKRLTYVTPAFKIRGTPLLVHDKISIEITDEDNIQKLKLIKKRIFEINFKFRAMNNRILAPKEDINMMKQTKVCGCLKYCRKYYTQQYFHCGNEHHRNIIYKYKLINNQIKFFGQEYYDNINIVNDRLAYINYIDGDYEQCSSLHNFEVKITFDCAYSFNLRGTSGYITYEICNV